VASLPAELIADITTIASPRHGWRGRGVGCSECGSCSRLAGVHGCRGPQVAPYHPPAGGRGGLQPLGAAHLLVRSGELEVFHKPPCFLSCFFLFIGLEPAFWRGLWGCYSAFFRVNAAFFRVNLPFSECNPQSAVKKRWQKYS